MLKNYAPVVKILVDFGFKLSCFVPFKTVQWLSLLQFGLV